MIANDPLALVKQERLVNLTKTMVAIPSITGSEEAISDWMVEHFDGIGLRGIQRLSVEEAGDSVIGWIDGPTDGPALVLWFHMDTFDAFDNWEGDPFAPKLEGNRLYGLGTHDMKGGAACVLGAVEALIHSRIELGGRVYVAASSDEENWSRGAHALINSEILQNCIGCLQPEPSSPGTLTIGARGRHVFHLSFQGKTVHAAYTGGINAAVDAARVAAALAEPDAIDLSYNEQFGLAGSIEIIGIHSGGTMILVPEHADLYVDRHILPGQTAEEAAEQIRQVIESCNLDGSYTLVWDERPTPAPTSFVVPPESTLVRTVQRNLSRQQGEDIRLDLARSVSDMNHVAVHGGIPTLICGPQGGNTCEANEYVEIDSLPKVTRTYIQTVLDLLGSNQ